MNRTMAKIETGVYIILGEVNLLLTTIKKNFKWSSSYNHQIDNENELITNLVKLKNVLNEIIDIKSIEPLEFLIPFLDIIRSEETTGPITGLALTAINKFLSYRLIECDPELSSLAVEQIADAVTHARFVGTDPSADEVVLLKILYVLKSLVLCPSGVLLTNESICEIMQSCFRICFEMRLSELLRKSAEHTLVDMVQLLFTRLPEFKDDAKWVSSMKKLKMRTGGMDAGKSSAKQRKKSPKVKTKAAAAASTTASSAGSKQDNKHHTISSSTVPTNETINLQDSSSFSSHKAESQQNQGEKMDEPPKSLSLKSDYEDEGSVSLVDGHIRIVSATTPVVPTRDDEKDDDIRKSTEQYEWIENHHEHQSLHPSSHHQLEPPVQQQPLPQCSLDAQESPNEIPIDHILFPADEHSKQTSNDQQNSCSNNSSKDFVNPRGIRFTSHIGQPADNNVETSHESLPASSSTGTASPSPYSIPCVRELLRFLISLTNPHDAHNSENMIHMGLSLITVALESGSDHVGHYKSLLNLIKDDMCRNLFYLLKHERLSLYAAAIRVCFLLFESMRGYLKLQLEMYFQKLMELIVSESQRVSQEHRELALESIIQMLRMPGLVTEMYLNYDCDLYCSNLFEDLTKLLSKNAFPLSGLSNTHLLSLDALLAIIDSIEENCHYRMNNNLKKDSADGPHDNNDVTIKKCNSHVNISTATSPGFGSLDNLPHILPSNTQSLMSKSLSTSESAFQTALKSPKIRPNRMPPSLKIPSSDELNAVKYKKKIYQAGTEQFNVKPQEGIMFLQKHGLLSQQLDPGEIVSFIKQNPKLDKKQIGEFISNRKNNNILEAYQKSFNFESTRIDEALRMYLETFRLPGEAPVISYLLEHFAEHWHKMNNEPFENADAAFTLAYAVIMLNVDQHNLNAKKQNTPMTCENFKKNLSKVNGGRDFDEEMLEEMFQSIKNEEIVMPAEHTGLVRDNYLWKALLRRSQSKDLGYLHAATGCFDRDLFSIAWGPTVAALSFVFDKSPEDAIIQKAITGFKKCAYISAHYEMSDVFDNLVISLCKFTTLLCFSESADSLAISFGNNLKAQLAARTVFALTHRHSDILHDGWRNILECITQLFKAKLLTEVLVKVEDFLDPSGRISIIREEQSTQHRTDSSMFSNLYTFFSLSSDAPQSKTPALEDQDSIKRAQDCILECHVEQLIIDSKFLREESLQELLKALIFASRCSDGLEDAVHGQHGDEETQVLRLELLFKVVLQNRDRIAPYWSSIEDHLYSILVNRTEATFLVERAVVGILRLAVRLLRREELAHQVLNSLRIILLMKPEVIHTYISRHVAYGMHDLLKANASSIHTTENWQIIFNILCTVGACMDTSSSMNDHCKPPPDEDGAQSDGELNSVKRVSQDRGYTSDSELYDDKKSTSTENNVPEDLGTPSKMSSAKSASSLHSNWPNTYQKNCSREKYVDGPNSNEHQFNTEPQSYSIILNENLGRHDLKSFSKCCETLSFLVRDAAHISPYNFESCIRTIRVFVEASVDGGVHYRCSYQDLQHQSSKKLTSQHGTHFFKSSKMKNRKDASSMRKSRSSPSHLLGPNRPNNNNVMPSDDEDGDSDAYQTISIQLLDLMHTLHTRAAAIFNSWAEEKQWSEEAIRRKMADVADDELRVAEDEITSAMPRNTTALTEAQLSSTTTLWSACWCPLLQGIARLCCDNRKQVRNHALTYLQRALLVHDLQVLKADEWQDCFSKVLFPLLSLLLETLDGADRGGAEETRMRASALLCKVFLQHLTPLLNLSTFTALWLTILDFMDKYMHADQSDLLLEAIPESLKNMLLVMHTAGILQEKADMDEEQLQKVDVVDKEDASTDHHTRMENQLWKLTWDRINVFLPTLKEEVFKKHDADVRPLLKLPPEDPTLPATDQPLPQTSSPSLLAHPAECSSVASHHATSHPPIQTTALTSSSNLDNLQNSKVEPHEVADDVSPKSQNSPESLLTSMITSINMPHQYVLHPPLPPVTDLQPRAGLPLIINQEILQSTVIPLISNQPSQMKIDSSGQ